MQVASTLWPDIKLQKISQHRFRLKQTKCSLRTQLKPLKTDWDQRGSDKATQDSPPEEGWARLAPWSGCGRPTRAMGPTASILPCGASLLLLQVGLGCCGRWLPPINTREGVENRTHTPHTSLHSPLKFLLAHSLGLVEFMRSLGVFELPKLLESSGMGSSLAFPCNIQFVCNRIRLWLPISARSMF